MSSVIKVGEGFTVSQVINSNGFTLDTTEFSDLLDEDEDFDYAKSAKLNNQEMLRLLNLEDEDDRKNNEVENIPFVGIAFETIKPKMHSIYGDGEILKLVKKEGVGEVVPSDAQVTVEYVGYFEYQDEPFDSTLFQRDKKMVLRLGKDLVIQGLEMAIKSMKKHEKSLFIIQPQLAYGKLGCLPRIPPDSEVLFKIELINFLDNGSADLYEELTNEEKKKFSNIEKIIRDLMNTARDSFIRQKIPQATKEYIKAVQYLENASLENDEEERNMNKLLSRALTNLTVCYNKINKPKLACSSFQRLPTKNGKAYFQNGKALVKLSEYDDAMDSLQKALSLCPDSKEIRIEIKNVEELRQKYLEDSRRFAQNSLQIVNDTQENGFEKLVNEMCETFIKNTTLLRQQIPHCLSAQEQDCIRRVAASHGLSITTQNRFDVETLFLTKTTYYSRETL